MWKQILLVLVLLIASFSGAFVWFLSLANDDIDQAQLRASQPELLPYLKHAVTEERGKILAVVTSTHKMGSTDKPTGYELTELSRAYYVFLANGFDVDIASPVGGRPPVVLDGDDMGKYDYAFLNDKRAQKKVENSISLSEVNFDEYQAVYFVGGKGTMFDFPDNPHIHTMVREFDKQGKVIAAVCHGPAALANVKLDNGTNYLSNKHVVSFTNEEELFLIPDAKEIFPFLLEDKLISQGAKFKGGPLYLDNVVVDENLITGQNPWSVWALAEQTVMALGYEPVRREITDEENSVNILIALDHHGKKAAYDKVEEIYSHSDSKAKKELVAVHAIVAVMAGEFGKAVDLIQVLRVMNKPRTHLPEVSMVF